MTVVASVIALPQAALAALSLAALLLALDHRRVNLGGRAALAFALAAVGYGLARTLSIRALAENHLSGMPYHLEAPRAALGGVPLQELVGWMLSAALATYWADRLLRRLAQPTDPFRTALVAGLGLAALCLAVETAAVAGGWWQWNLTAPLSGPIRFPAIALLDWGFVAFDLILPFELWRHRSPSGSPAPLAWRLASLTFFPLHLLGHAYPAPLPEPWPISGFDLAHLGLVALAIAGAATTRAASPWPAPEREAQRDFPLAAAAILLATAATQLALAGEAVRIAAGIPVALFALVARTAPRAAAKRGGAALSPLRAAGLFAAFLTVALALRAPAVSRSREFERALRQGAEQLVAGRGAATLPLLRRAQELRPANHSALWLLGWAELEAGNRAEARRLLERALEQRPTSREAQQLLARLEAEERAASGER